jgi:hypothetical protein
MYIMLSTCVPNLRGSGMSGTYSNAYSRRVQKISITLAILEEFLVNSLFHETKIPTIDIKVLVYSNS